MWWLLGFFEQPFWAKMKNIPSNLHFCAWLFSLPPPASSVLYVGIQTVSFLWIIVILKRLYASEAEKCWVEIPDYLHLLHCSVALLLISWDSSFVNQIKQLSAFTWGIKLIHKQGRASINGAQWCHSRYLRRHQLRSPAVLPAARSCCSPRSFTGALLIAWCATSGAKPAKHFAKTYENVAAGLIPGAASPWDQIKERDGSMQLSCTVQPPGPAGTSIPPKLCSGKEMAFP